MVFESCVDTMSWFNFYCLVRTYANSLEAALVAAAVYHWGLHRGDSGRTGGSHQPAEGRS